MTEIHWRPPNAALRKWVDGLTSGATVAVDADGTLWNIDLGDELVRAAGEKGSGWPFAVDAPRYFNDLAADHCLASAYSAQVASATSAAAVQKTLSRAIRPLLRPRSELIDPLKAALARGVHVHVVSASPVEAIPAGLALIGLQPTSIIAAQGKDGTWPDPATLPVGEGKVRHWQLRGLGPIDLALGDSRWDLPLLQSAKVGVLVAAMNDEKSAAIASAFGLAV